MKTLLTIGTVCVLGLISCLAGCKEKAQSQGEILCGYVRDGNMQAMEAAVDEGWDLNQVGADGMGPLHVAAFEGAGDMIEVLVTHGADVEFKDEKNGAVAAVYAVQNKQAEALTQLLNFEADVNAKSADGQTLLHWAAAGNNTVAIQLLVDRGADLGAQDNEGNTALHTAVFSNVEPDALELLLSLGADPTLNNNNGKTTLKLAEEMDKAGMVNLIKQYVH